MGTNFEPPPTWDNPVHTEKDPATGQQVSRFSPVWLNWFITLGQLLSNSGAANSGTNTPGGGQIGSKPITVNIADYVTEFGDAVDNTAALNKAIKAVYDAGGGSLYIGDYVRADGAVIIPNDGAVSAPIQSPIRIFGNIGTSSGYLQPTVLPPAKSVLDLRYGGTGSQLAKIDTRGAGLLEIDHLVILSGGTDDELFIRTTNTTLHIHHNYFRGNGANSQTSCVQDVIRLGGDGSGTPQTLDAEAFFQGYGTIICDNYYDHIQAAIVFGSQCNGIEVRNETVAKTCGSGDAHGAPFWFDTGPGGGQFACVIRNGTIEIGSYKHVVRLDQTIGCVFDSISAYDDFAAYFDTLVYCDALSTGNLVIATWYPNGAFSGANKDDQVFWSPYYTKLAQSAVGRPSAVTAGIGGMFYDAALSVPIFSDGTIWRDAAGAPV